MRRPTRLMVSTHYFVSHFCFGLVVSIAQRYIIYQPLVTTIVFSLACYFKFSAGFGGANCQFDYGIRAPSPRPSAVDCGTTAGESPCLNGGTCRLLGATSDYEDEDERVLTRTCECAVGFTGHDCSAKVGINRFFPHSFVY